MNKNEKAVIGCILLDAKVALGACLKCGVEPEWFTDGTIRRYYEKSLEYFGKGKIIDLITMNDGTNAQELDDMADTAVSPYSIDGYLDKLEKDHILRLANVTHNRHSDILNDKQADIHESISTISGDWLGLISGKKVDEPLVDVGNKVIDIWEKPVLENTKLSWPIDSIQRRLGNIQDDYIYMAAKESIGKTALAIQTQLCLGYKGITTSLASLESSLQRVVPRFIAMIAQVNTFDMKNGRGTPDMFKRSREAVEKIGLLPMRVTERSMTIDQFHAWAMAEKAAGSQLLILDNMKHIRMPMSNKKTNEHFREISLRLKWIRDDLRMPILVLHHLNKEGELSWSSDINRDADIIITMENDEQNTILPTEANGFIGRSIVNFNVEKNRDGEAHFTVPLQFKKHIQTFEEWK